MTAAVAGECRIVEVERRLTAVVRAVVPMDRLPEAQRAIRATINAVLPSLDVGPLGRACTLWRPPVNGRLDMEPGIIVARGFAPAGEVVPSALPAGRAAHFLLAGSYEGLPGASGTLFAWCARRELALANVNWEIYGEHEAEPSRQETALYALLA